MTFHNAKPLPLPSDGDISGRTFGADELFYLEEVIRSGTLTSTKGTFVKRFEAAFSDYLGIEHCRAVATGTAAVHTAIAAIDPEPGDEIITSSITDMGAVTPILYQAAIPVFADVDPATFNVTAATIEKKISKKTRAIIVTHLFGNPCDMEPILALAAEHGIPVIEDACQAYGALCREKKVGTFGAAGCFSLQQGKHISAGEGGMVVTGDAALHHRMRLFSDKAWDYEAEAPDHGFLALNYRMSELQGAVALAQLNRLAGSLAVRRENAARLSRELESVEGLGLPESPGYGMHAFWRYPLRIEPTAFSGGVDAFSAALKERGIYNLPRYIKKPAFLCGLFQKKKTFGNSRFPFESPYRKGLPEIVYDMNDYPGTRQALDTVIVLPWNEKYTQTHIAYIADAVKTVARSLRK